MTSTRARGFGVGLRFVAAAVLVGLAVQACAFGTAESPQARDPRALADSAARAIATAPGVHYSLSIATAPDQGGLGSEGDIAFDGRRFSGTADGGPGGWMLFFGGPASGALVVADGLFVRTENGPWEPQPPRVEQAAFLDKLMDRTGLSEAIASTFKASQIDPADPRRAVWSRDVPDHRSDTAGAGSGRPLVVRVRRHGLGVAARSCPRRGDPVRRSVRLSGADGLALQGRADGHDRDPPTGSSRPRSCDPSAGPLTRCAFDTRQCRSDTSVHSPIPYGVRSRPQCEGVPWID